MNQDGLARRTKNFVQKLRNPLWIRISGRGEGLEKCRPANNKHPSPAFPEKYGIYLSGKSEETEKRKMDIPCKKTTIQNGRYLNAKKV
ncbi:hypothetical protein JTE90_004888 [Oedothorax gibbosus]|uniref:Uncharacterized protein n=1 Tax=Oedothorax gibbosus TaxID=931172 RepID=A0AAV6UUE0_9ARAC|nr:hypothetical protein JTE90_004888 [Oedothorax gibbosus]